MKEQIQLENKTVFITGAAGFIGANLVMKLIKEYKSLHIIGIDNMNDYYDVSLKEYRLEQIESLVAQTNHRFEFVKGDICDNTLITELFQTNRPAVVVNLAAQAGVRYSITNPDVYIQSNIIGFYNILQACRNYPVEHLVYASSSSVYGSNKKVPYATSDKVDNPVSLYAATKKSNELLAHAYSKLYNIPSTGLRFFTVYGPAGRPDMAYFSFTNKLIKGETIQIFNYGNCKRDFTFVDDIVEGVYRVMQGAPEALQLRHDLADHELSLACHVGGFQSLLILIQAFHIILCDDEAAAVFCCRAVDGLGLAESRIIDFGLDDHAICFFVHN